jgi:hypothetical protein
MKKGEEEEEDALTKKAQSTTNKTGLRGEQGCTAQMHGTINYRCHVTEAMWHAP